VHGIGKVAFFNLERLSSVCLDVLLTLSVAGAWIFLTLLAIMLGSA